MGLIITPQAATAMCGVTVDEAAVTLAQSVVEAVTGADLGATPPVYSQRDLRHLGRAVAWQARYLTEHPELLTREGGLASASTNGNALSWREGSDGEASLVAPFAAMALRRLSWRGHRSVRMVPAERPVIVQSLVGDGADSEWRPLS